MNLKLTNSISLTDQSDTGILLFTALPPHTKARIIVMHYLKFWGDPNSGPSAYKSGTLLADPSTQTQSIRLSILNSILDLNSHGRTLDY